ncbi:MAG: serine/threonine protein kinase [Candidatus Riflebacteria bacterium]|nr:serine/threonine protein kinase [Candidatus Riflebacteria bacterium]
MPREKLPQRFGRYEVLDRVGSGGMGVVLRASDPQLRREVAVKCVPAAVMTLPSAIGRFHREAQILAHLSHPNIVRVFDSGEEEGYLYYVMELLNGRGLDQRTPAEVLGVPRMEAPPFDLAEFKQVFVPMCRALQAIHEAGLVHRDVKPANILAGVPERGPVLTDFGLALVSGAERLTETGMVVGTGRYMAPEQLSDTDPGLSCDLYALGMTMWEFTTGRVPFEDLHGPALLVARQTAQPPSVQRFQPEIPDDLAAVVDRCVQLAPGDRYPSARELEHALDKVSRASRKHRKASLPGLDRTLRHAAPGPSPHGDREAAEQGPVFGQSHGEAGAATRLPRSVWLLGWGLPAVACAILVLAGVALWREAGHIRERFRALGSGGTTTGVPESLTGTVPAGSAERPAGDGSSASAGPAPAPLIPVLLSESQENCRRAAFASLGSALAAVWVGANGSLSVSTSADRGRTWRRPRCDRKLRVLTNTEVSLFGSAGRWHLFFQRGGPSGEAIVCHTTAVASLEVWAPPVDLGRIFREDETIQIAADLAATGRNRMLAAWEPPGSGSITVSWLVDGRWTTRPGPPISAVLGRFTALFPPGRDAMLIWQQDNPARAVRDLYVSRSAGPGSPWSPPARLCLVSSGYDRIYPASCVLPSRTYLMFCEMQLPLHPMVLAASIDGGDCFQSIGKVSVVYGKDARSALGAHGKRAWSSWTLPEPDRLVWASSMDEGRTWSNPIELAQIPRHLPASSIAVTSAGDAWLLWVTPTRQAQVMRLP